MIHLNTKNKPKRFSFINFLAVIVLSLILSNKIYSQSTLQIKIMGNRNFTESDYNLWASSSKLDLKSPALTDSVQKRISSHLVEEGYLFAKIKTDSLRLNTDSSKTTIYLTVNEGKPVYLASISLSVAESTDSVRIYSNLRNLIGEIFYPARFNNKLNSIVEKYSEEGFPFANFKLNNVSFIDSSKIKLYLGFSTGITATIDTIVVEGNSKTNRDVIIRNGRIMKGEKYSESKIAEIPLLLKKLDFFKTVDKPKYFFDSQKRGTLLLKVEEKSTNYFDGIIGYIPKTEKRNGYFTGSVQIDLRNLLGTGRAFGFKWNKFDVNSQYFEIYYLEPWIFGLPINLHFDVNQKTEDSTYIKRSYSSKVNYLATERLTASLIYSYAETIPSTDTNKLTVYHSTFSNSGLAFLYDTRDDYYVPTKGFFVNLSLIYSRKNILGPARFISDKNNLTENYFKVESRAGVFVSVTPKMVTAFTLSFNDISGPDLEISDLYKFGGAKSVRGYRLEQFSGDKIVWSNFEYRLLFSRDSYAFIFFDSGYYYNRIIRKQNLQDYKQFIYGYGAGLNFPTGLGNMSVSFALGKGDSFSDGKLNFGIVNRF